MKQFAYFLSVVIILLGCGQQQQSKEQKQQKPDSNAAITDDAIKNLVKSDDTLKSIINENIHKQPAIDTVFLGFTFGMSKKALEAHFNRLVKEKKLFYNEQNERYEYKLNLENVKANAAIAAKYNDNKLYELTLIITPADEITLEKLVYIQTAIAFREKYKDFTLFKQEDPINPEFTHYHWIKDNLHIFQHKNVEGIIVNYINLPVEQALDKKEKSSADSGKKQSQKDI